LNLRSPPINFPLASTTMATKTGGAIRSYVLECSPLLFPHKLRSMGLRISYHTPPDVSRLFTTGARKAATPATDYVRKTAETRQQAPQSSTSAAQPSVGGAKSPVTNLSNGLADEPLILDEGDRQVDWTRSFHGLSAEPFSKEAADVLLAPIPFDDVECKPDGIIYLPEIKYRRILNRAFGPGGWGLAPRSETIVTGKSITREYALVAHGR
jgi:hypothetical protein